jgi:hypothetical protein
VLNQRVIIAVPMHRELGSDEADSVQAIHAP